MSSFAESLARLYTGGKVSLEKLDALLVDGKITADEYASITAAPPATDELQTFYDEVVREVGI